MYIDPATERHKIEDRPYYLVLFPENSEPIVCGFCEGGFVNDERIVWLIEHKYKLTETEPNFDVFKFAEDL